MMEEKTVFLVINPVSGTSQPENVKRRFEAIMQEAGWNIQVYETTGKENLAEVVREHIEKGADMVVAAGGDGTISNVGSGMVNSHIPLGVLPTGTWNALSHNLGIPILLDEAIRLLIKPHSLIELDSLEVAGRHYLLNVGIGLSAAIIQMTRRQQKRRFGFLAYIWNLLMQAFGLRERQFRLQIDGNEVKLRASELMVINSSIIGLGELPTVLEILPYDGKVEIIALRSPSLFGLLGIAFNILIGRRRTAPGFESFAATHNIQIRARRRMVVQADGEIIGHTPVEIAIHPNAVQMIVPENSKILR